MALEWKRHYLVILTLVFIVLGPYSKSSYAGIESNSASIVELVKGDNISLVGYSQVLQDDVGELTWQQAKSSDAWTHVITDDLNFGISSSAYWFKISVKYIEDQIRIYQIHYPLLDYVDFYILDQNRLIKHVATGDSLPFKSRIFEDKDFVLSHYAKNNQELMLLIRVKTQGTMVLPLTSVDIENYAQDESLETIAYGIYFGITLAMLIYNFMLFVYLKEKSYLYYCVFVFVIFISALAYTGHGFHFFWPHYNEINRYITPVASAIGFLAASMFMANFLQIKSRGLWEKRVYNVCIALSIFVIVIAVFLSYSASIIVMSLVQWILTILFLGTSIRLWLKGVSEAKYFTIAWLFFISGNFISSVRVLGIVPSNFFTVYANLYGNVFEMLLLSMGLAHRFESMRKVQTGLSRELRFAQQDAIKNLERFRDLFQQSPVGLFRYDRESNSFFNNLKLVSLIGNRDVKGFLKEVLIFGDYKKLIRKGEVKDKVIKFKAGKVYSLSLITVTNDQERVVEIEGTLFDVTEQKLAEANRIMSEKEKLSTLTQLVVGISHQFNTPLGVLITTEDLVKQNLSQILEDISSGQLRKDELLQSLYMIQDAMDLSSDNTKVMSRILKNLRYSINTRTNLNVSKINLDTFFTDLMGYYKSQLKEEGRECLLEIEVLNSTKDALYCDYDIISDVILRLYANTYSHGYSEKTGMGKIKVIVSGDKDFTIIEYFDDGRGLNEKEKGNIFIPFFTGDSRQKDNSGLGMFILHNQIVKILQGKIELLAPEVGFGIKIQIPKVYVDTEGF